MTKPNTDGDGKIGMAEAIDAMQKVDGRCGYERSKERGIAHSLYSGNSTVIMTKVRYKNDRLLSGEAVVNR